MNVDPKSLKLVGDNMLVGEIEGKIVIVIDPAKRHGLSKSGKMEKVAGTNGGFQNIVGEVDGNIWLGVKK